MRTFFKRLFCKHEFQFSGNLYGDQIAVWNYMRSVWTCQKCGKLQGRHFLHEPREVSKDV